MSDYTDIQPELDDFENAVYGEEVRGSMVSAIKKIHDIAESAAGAPDASTAAAGQAPIADGQGGWAWGDVQGVAITLTDVYYDLAEAGESGDVSQDVIDSINAI